VLCRGIEEGRFTLTPGTWRLCTGVTSLVVGITVLLCVVRGIPVLWDSRDLLLHRPMPRPRD
jgi:hypothetical protein